MYFLLGKLVHSQENHTFFAIKLLILYACKTTVYTYKTTLQHIYTHS